MHAVASRRGFLVASAAALAGALLPRAVRAAVAEAASRWPMPPAARRVRERIGAFGHARFDDYAWLRPRDWLAVLRDPASLEAPIRRLVEAENAYAQAMLEPALPLRRELQARIDAIAAAHAPMPEIVDGGYAYATRWDTGAAVYARRPLAGGAEEVLLDTARDAAGCAAYALHWNGPQHSADGRVFGWAADLTGAEQYRLRVREIASGKQLGDDIEGVPGEFAFSGDGRYLYWVGRNTGRGTATVMRRDLVEGGDVLVHDEQDPRCSISLRSTAAGGYVAIRIDNMQQSELRLVPAGVPAAAPVLVAAREPGLDYDVDEWNGALLVTTNADGAGDRKLMSARFDAPGRAHWQPLLPQRPGTAIASAHPFARALVRQEWRDALPRLAWRHADGREREIAFELPAYSLYVPGGQDWNAETILFACSAPTTPMAWYRLDLASGEFAPVVEAAPVAGFDPSRYEVRRIAARSTDGESVPITVLMRAGQALDGSAPLHLYGYGSYGLSADADFRPASLALVERGWICALAHVRGGGERGPRWWRQVLGHGKERTFADFIVCADHLVANGYAKPGRIVAQGLSAGGLLMGVVFNRRPELWAGVIAPVAFMDVLTTMDYYERHPLGATGLTIWGDPRVPADRACIEAYSPYDNLHAAAYPALLVTGALGDGSVSFWEPLKFAIKARTLTTAGNPILSLTAMSGGHLGELGAGAGSEQQAMFLAFAIWAAERRWGEVPQRAGQGEAA